MKKKLGGYFTLLLILFTACSKEESPKPVAEKFLNAMQKRDYSEASKYGTKETVKLLKQLQRIEKLSNKDLDEFSGKINIVSEDIRGRTAVVYFTEEGDVLQQKITLKKVPGSDDDKNTEWKVDLGKEEMRLNHKRDLSHPADSLPSKIPA